MPGRQCVSRRATGPMTGRPQREAQRCPCIGDIRKGETTMPSNHDADRVAGHWAKTRNLTFIILGLWFVFAFILPWYTKALNAFTFMGFPLGFYFIAQGSLIAFVVMIFVQNWFQDKIDDEFGFHEE
jgi:putative solute:sodium symporter small subunit